MDLPGNDDRTGASGSGTKPAFAPRARETIRAGTAPGTWRSAPRRRRRGDRWRPQSRWRALRPPARPSAVDRGSAWPGRAPAPDPGRPATRASLRRAATGRRRAARLAADEAALPSATGAPAPKTGAAAPSRKALRRRPWAGSWARYAPLGAA